MGGEVLLIFVVEEYLINTKSSTQPNSYLIDPFIILFLFLFLFFAFSLGSKRGREKELDQKTKADSVHQRGRSSFDTNQCKGALSPKKDLTSYKHNINNARSTNYLKQMKSNKQRTLH